MDLSVYGIFFDIGWVGTVYGLGFFVRFSLFFVFAIY